MLRLRKQIKPKGAFASLRKSPNTSQLVGCALEIFVKRSLFQVHVPGTNQATPVLFCHQVRLHIPSRRDQAPRLTSGLPGWAETLRRGAPTQGAAPKPQPGPLLSPGRKPGKKKGGQSAPARLTCREDTSGALIFGNSACPGQGVDSPSSFLSATYTAFPRSRRRALASGGTPGTARGPSTPRPGGGDKVGRGRPPPGACGACESVCRAQRTDSAGSPWVRGEDAGRLPRPGPAVRSVRRHRRCPLRPRMLSRSPAPLPARPGA